MTSTGVSVSVNDSVCVLGATGFIGGWIVKTLIDRGYKDVRITVRNKAKLSEKSLLGKLYKENKLKVFEADVFNEEALTQAITGCKGVFHCASPVLISPSDPVNDLFIPTLKGMENVLHACTKARIKKLVITATIETILDATRGRHGVLFDEDSWNNSDTLETAPYSYSKTAAEKKAWEYQKSLSPEQRFDLVSTHPTLVIGPLLDETFSVTLSNSLILDMFNMRAPFLYPLMNEFGIKALTAHPHRFRCHVLIMENPRAKGRYIVNNDIMWQKDLSAVMRKLYPERPIATFVMPSVIAAPLISLASGMKLQVVRRMLDFDYKVSNKRLVEEILPKDFKFIPVETTLREACESFLRYGFARPKSKQVVSTFGRVIVALILLGLIMGVVLYVLL